MLVNDELYFQTFCKLLEAVVEAGGVEAPVENLQKSHFYFLSRKINAKSSSESGIQPTTIRDYRYIYKREKKFSVRQNRLDLMCEFLGYQSWFDFRSHHFTNPEKKLKTNEHITLLILPDKRFGAVRQFEGQIGELICNRYEALKEELGIDELEIIYQDSLKSSPTGIKGIRNFGKANKADLVIWTEYLHGKNPVMRVPSIFVDPCEKFGKCNKQPYQDAADLINLHSGAFLEETDMMLFQLLATVAYEKGAIERALEYIEKVLQLDPTHKEANNFMSLIIAREEMPIQSKNPVDAVIRSEKEIDVQEKSDSKTIHFDQLRPQKPRLDEFYHHDASNKLKRNHLPQYAASLDNHLLILEGDNRVLKVKDLEPLIRNTLIHEEETIIFLTTQTDMALLSLNDLTVFKLKTSQQEVPIKEALVRLNPWKQNTPVSPKHDDQPPLRFHSSNATKYTEQESIPDKLIGIILLPNAGDKIDYRQATSNLLENQNGLTPTDPVRV